MVKVGDRPFYYARYIDWYAPSTRCPATLTVPYRTLTTPLLLLDLLMLAGCDTVRIAFVIFLDLVMVITGLLGTFFVSGSSIRTDQPPTQPRRPDHNRPCLGLFRHGLLSIHRHSHRTPRPHPRLCRPGLRRTRRALRPARILDPRSLDAIPDRLGPRRGVQHAHPRNRSGRVSPARSFLQLRHLTLLSHQATRSWMSAPSPGSGSGFS